MDKAVSKLHNDLTRFRAAEKNLKAADAAETKAAKQPAADKAAEQKQLASIATQKQAIMDEFSSATPPDAQQQTQLLNQMYALGQKQVNTTDAYTAKFAKDKSAIAHDKTSIAKDKKSQAADKKKALKDLPGAEVHMNLKDTNRVRTELGLHKVSKPIRPAEPDVSKVVTNAKKYLGKFETQLQAEGVTQRGVDTSECCANFVSAMLKKSGLINFHTDLVRDLNTGLRSKGWHQVSLKDAKPGDVWICNGAGGESHTEIVASNHNGHVTLIGSNNHPVNSNQQINYDSGSANISGSFILAPPKHK